MDTRKSQEQTTLSLPTWFESVATVRCIDGIAKDVTFRVYPDDPDQAEMYIADRAKVKWRSTVATKSLKQEDGSLKEVRLLTIAEVKAKGVIELRLSEQKVVRGEKKPKVTTERDVGNYIETADERALRLVIEEAEKELEKRERAKALKASGFTA